jgi:hypothetical protein
MRIGRTWVLVLWLAAAAGAHAQLAYQPPRTPDGRADLQGVWISRWITPLERQAPLKNLVMAPEEVGPALKAEWERHDRLDGVESVAGFEFTSFVVVRGETRSSIIVDPPDGRLPLTPEARARFRPGPSGTEDVEQRGLNERCMSAGNGFAPHMAAPAGNIRRIVQTRDHVVVWTELMSQLRIIPTDGHSATGARGETIAGRWDGDTLVVENTGFLDRTRGARGSNFPVSPRTRITERFSRTGPSEITYSFTVEDTALYTRPWTGETVMVTSSDPMFEFACHEGNYGLANILRGARVVEERAASALTKSRSPPAQAGGFRFWARCARG